MCYTTIKTMLASIACRMLRSIAWSIPGSNARTYGRTNEQPLTLGNYPWLENARRGGERFPSNRGESADATRGPIRQRTPEEHRADVIACALADLPGMFPGAAILHSRIAILAGSLGAFEALPPALLIGYRLPSALIEIQEALVDMAATNPIHGLDYTT